MSSAPASVAADPFVTDGCTSWCLPGTGATLQEIVDLLARNGFEHMAEPIMRTYGGARSRTNLKLSTVPLTVLDLGRLRHVLIERVIRLEIGWADVRSAKGMELEKFEEWRYVFVENAVLQPDAIRWHDLTLVELNAREELEKANVSL